MLNLNGSTCGAFSNIYDALGVFFLLSFSEKQKVFLGLRVSHCNLTSWNGVGGRAADGEPEAGVGWTTDGELGAGVGQAADRELVEVMWSFVAESLGRKLAPKLGLAGWRPESLRRWGGVSWTLDHVGAFFWGDVFHRKGIAVDLLRWQLGTGELAGRLLVDSGADSRLAG